MTTTNPTITEQDNKYNSDQLHRYLFDNKHARGELVQLSDSYQSILTNHHYPDGVKHLLGELLVATSLLTATLKIAGEISVQLQGDGPVAYMAVNSAIHTDTEDASNNKQEMRGIAKLGTEIRSNSEITGLHNLIGKGNMIITIRPTDGEAYQGVVALEEDSLAKCLSHYFDVSEQIPTHISLFVNNNYTLAAGCLVQLLPDGDDKDQQLADFEHLSQLTNTIKAEEILTLSANELLYRLYHQENVQLYPAQTISFKCGCSEEKCLNAIAQIEVDEIKAILAEQGKISMTCEYCQTTYAFDETNLAGLLADKKH